MSHHRILITLIMFPIIIMYPRTVIIIRVLAQAATISIKKKLAIARTGVAMGEVTMMKVRNLGTMTMTMKKV